MGDDGSRLALSKRVPHGCRNMLLGCRTGAATGAATNRLRHPFFVGNTAFWVNRVPQVPQQTLPLFMTILE
jgi:hypothetical protein